MNENWLVLDDELKPAWEREASARSSELLGTDVVVRLTLPGKEDARTAWNGNLDLRGKISFVLDGCTVSTAVSLPYRGVFIARSRRNGHAQAFTWNAWLGENPGMRMLRPVDSDVDGADALVFRFAKRDGRSVDVGLVRKARPGKCSGYWRKAGDFEIRINTSPDEDVWRAQAIRLDARDMKGLPDEVAMRLSGFYEAVDACRAENPSDDFCCKAAGCLYNVLVEYLKHAAGHKFRGEIFDHEDLAHRQFISFPRWLLETVCQRICKLARLDSVKSGKMTVAQAFSRQTVASLVPVSILAKAMDRLSPCLIRVQPKNAVELRARLTCVRRRRLSKGMVDRLSEMHRQNHDSFDGRICPIETPESEQVGLTLQLAKDASVSADGQIAAGPEASGVQGRLAWGTGLVPFANCNDGARNMMGAKNLRQALPIDGRESPCVKTGVEELLREQVSDFVEIGICPDCNDSRGEFALGRDLLVAYMPWYGWNVDDAVVVSKDIVKDFAVNVRKHFRQEIGPEWRCVEQLPRGTQLTNGVTVAKLVDNRKREYCVRYLDPTPAVLEEIKVTPPLSEGGAFATTFEYSVSKKIPLGVGDKIMGRHGNKGVVASVLDGGKMPRLPDALGGRPVDIVLNPHGVLSRKNPAQLLETHLGWLFRNGVKESEVKARGDDARPVGAPEVGIVDHRKIRKLLAEKGLDDDGRVRLVLPDGTETESPVVVGYEHVVRLCHIPELKSQARRGGAGASYSESTGQAVHGRKFGGGQRLGEMEVWALAAQESDALLEEMLGGKSDGEWARQWEEGDALPAGDPDQGFPAMLKDWLLAMGVAAERKDGMVEFRLVKTVEDFLSIKPEASELLSADGYATVYKAAFKCVKCAYGLDGVFAFGENANAKSLSLRCFLRELGYEIGGALSQAGDGYRIALQRDGLPAGGLDVEFRDYDAGKDWLKARITPSREDGPRKWPKDVPQVFCYMQAPLKKADLETVRKDRPNWKGKNWPAGALLRMFAAEDGAKSVGDMMLTCANGHFTSCLRPVEPYGRSVVAIEGGLFDPGLFGGRGWGYIKLPVEIPHPVLADATLSFVPVMPLAYRKPVDATGWRFDRHELSRFYGDVIEAKGRFDAGVAGAEAQLASAVNALTAELIRRFDDKHGIVRRNGLGRRVDRSARAVIVPNPELRWDQAGISANLLWELLGDECRHVRIDPSILAADKSIEESAGWAYRRTDDMPASGRRDIQGGLDRDSEKLIVLNRQPTLHRDGMQAFHPLVAGSGVSDVVQLSPLACKGFAADFDGDEMVVHYPVSDAAQRDARKMTPGARLTSGATGECMANFDRDFVTGLELLYAGECNASAGPLHSVLTDACCRQMLARRDGDGGPFYRMGGGSSFGKAILEHVCARHADRAVEMVSRLSAEAFAACTRAGVSFGFYDIMDYPERRSGSIALVTESGANGGKQLPTDIMLARGMPWAEMFRQSYAARSAMCEKKLGASKSGGLTRQLVLALWPWAIVAEDCGAEEHSVVDCRCKRGVCAKCYGAEMYGSGSGLMPDGKPIAIGAPVGLVAAQSIGERGTQLTMQSIHGVAGEKGFDLQTARRLLLYGGGKGECRLYFDAGRSRRENVDAFVNRLTAEKAYAEIDRRHVEMVWRALERSGCGDDRRLSELIAGDEDVARSVVSKEQAENFIALAAGDGTSGKGVMPLDSPFAKVLGNLFGQRKLEK